MKKSLIILILSGLLFFLFPTYPIYSGSALKSNTYVSQSDEKQYKELKKELNALLKELKEIEEELQCRFKKELIPRLKKEIERLRREIERFKKRLKEKEKDDLIKT